jgi:Leucine-rich repeat (LRR) protein
MGVAQQTDLTKITYLNLFNNRIKNITSLDSLINLTTLVLSFNEIETIEGLNGNT